jgi:type II secretory pathway predicted ATPase ExeA
MREALGFFGLHREPFGKSFAVDEMWIEPSREAAVTRLVSAAQARQHALVTGEPGVGKTVAVRALDARLPAAHHKVVYVWNVSVGRRDFYRHLSLALGFEPKGTAAAVFEAIQRELRNGWVEHRVHPVLVIDEAHCLPDATLQHLHVLTNFDMDSNPLLSLVLVGLPELKDRLKLGVNRSLLTRLGAHVEIGRTTPEDTAAFVRNRLERAGAKGDLFATDAMTVAHELTAGVPRVVASLADAALRLGADKQERLISRATVRQAWQHLPMS